MKKISKILKGGVLAAFATLVIAGPVFATTVQDCESKYDIKLVQGSSSSGSTDYTLKCSNKITIEGKKYTVYAKNQSGCAQAGSIASNPEVCSGDDLNGIITIIINTLIFVIGMVAVIMIILGGISYATSQGDPAKVKKGKDTILYGIIGLVVALLAFAIVNFVLGALNG